MKLSISNIGFDINDDEEMMKYLSSHGMDLEIAPTRFVGENPYEDLEASSRKSKELMDKYHIKISSMQSIWYGIKENIFESEEVREKLINYTKKAIDFAVSVGCSNLVFGSPKNRNMTKDTDYNIALDFFKEIGLYAQEKNVVIAIEPNPVIYNTNFLNYTLDAIEFVKKINLPSILVNYDLGTVIYNKEDINILKNNISYINHIHISEPHLVKIEKRKLHEDLFQLLKELNYDKYVSIEMGKCDITEVKRVIDYVAELNK